MDFEDEDSSTVLNGQNPLYITNAWSYGGLPRIRSVLDWNKEEVPLRLGLCGAFSTGKTILAKTLSSILDIPLIIDVERTVASAGLGINKKTDIVSQLTIWMTQFYEQLQIAQFVSDMTHIDCLSYLLDYQKQHDIGPQNRTITIFTNLIGEMLPHDYTMIFYNPIQTMPTSDGVRSVDRKFQARIDRIIVGALETYGVEYIPLTGSLSQKVATVMAYLEGGSPGTDA